VPVSAVDAISPAFQHAKKQLLEPFSISQWAKLAFVGLLAGELSSSGGCNSNFQLPHQTGGISRNFAAYPFPEFHTGSMIALIVLLAALGLVFGILLLYISSVMRFVLFDSIVEKQCRILPSWRRRTGAGFRYFLWQIVFVIACTVVMGLLFLIPWFIAFSLGWLREPKAHLIPLILGGIFLFFVFAALIIAALVIVVLTKDFVVPQMALENIDAFEGWRRLLYMMNAEKGSYLVYVLMKIVMAIGAAVVIGIAAVIVTLLIMLPLGGVGVIAVIAGKAAGMSWNLYTITLAAVFVVLAVGLLLYVISLISVPAIVFFPAYSLYFLAGRYPRLDMVLRPQPPAPPQAPPPLPAILPAG
jgi:hypothetical protein